MSYRDQDVQATLSAKDKQITKLEEELKYTVEQRDIWRNHHKSDHDFDVIGFLALVSVVATSVVWAVVPLIEKMNGGRVWAMMIVWTVVFVILRVIKIFADNMW